MTDPSGKFRIRRRGALLLILSCVAAAPLSGWQATDARADKGDGGGDGGGGGNGGGGDGGGGSDDGGNDDGGNDDGGNDDGGNDDGGNDDGGSSGGGSSGSGGSGSSGSGSSGSGSSGSGGSGASGSGGGSSAGNSGNGGKQSGRSGSQSRQARDAALARKLKGRIASIRDVEAIAGRAVPGEVLDVKLYRNGDTYIYKVKIIQQTGSIYDVRIDAVSRKLLSKRER